ncbi:hypothetical protein ACGFXC_10430 [Streptomyces sp. NPDC048507]|uniref:hypothetical protein n=1 Tax=Streptomyces sp. NPDC048507 TaxID=3365560 RepID=UPI00371F6D72
MTDPEKITRAVWLRIGDAPERRMGTVSGRSVEGFERSLSAFLRALADEVDQGHVIRARSS